MNKGFDLSQGRGREPNAYKLMSQWQQQDPDPANDPRFQQSKSLRDHIMERLAEQQQCLGQASQRVGNLQRIGASGQQAASGRGPGDEQISADRIAWQVNFRQGLGGSRDPYDMDLGRLDGRRGRGGPLLGGMGNNTWISTMGMQPQNTNKNGKQKKAEKDPITRYQELEGEIVSLMAMSSVEEQQSQDNPYQVMADKANLMAKAATNARQALDDRMAKLIGPGDGMGGYASPSTAASTPAMQPQLTAPPQQQYGYPQAAPPDGGGTLADF